jgi:hypothetical protein
MNAQSSNSSRCKGKSAIEHPFSECSEAVYEDRRFQEYSFTRSEAQESEEGGHNGCCE